MEFSIEFYITAQGKCPPREFLDQLKKTDPDDFAAVMAGLDKLRNRNYHRPPLSKPVGEDLFELRHVGKLNTRMLYFFRKGQQIIILHGIRNKAMAISDEDLKIAIQRKRDLIGRKPSHLEKDSS